MFAFHLSERTHILVLIWSRNSLCQPTYINHTYQTPKTDALLTFFCTSASAVDTKTIHVQLSRKPYKISRRDQTLKCNLQNQSNFPIHSRTRVLTEWLWNLWIFPWNLKYLKICRKCTGGFCESSELLPRKEKFWPPPKSWWHFQTFAPPFLPKSLKGSGM